MGNPETELITLQTQLSDNETKLISQNNDLLIAIEQQTAQTAVVNDLVNVHSVLVSKFSSLLEKDKQLSGDKLKIETSIKEYNTKRSNILKSAKDLAEDIRRLKESQAKLIVIDYSQIDILTEKIELIREEISKHKAIIQSNIQLYEELIIPIPDDSVCKHCRQPLTDEHKVVCKNKVADDILQCNNNIEAAKNMATSLTAAIQKYTRTINDLNLSKQKLENINIEIATKSKEIQDKKAIHDEYKQLLDKFSTDLAEKIIEIESVKEELKNSSIEEANNIQKQIEQAKKQLEIINIDIAQRNKEISHINSTKAVIQYNINQLTKNSLKQKDLKDNLVKQENALKIYQHVIQAFSAVGIPNLIIQNVLDDLQIEANNLLSQLKPGLQLSFVIEKTKGDGTQDDTLEINYLMNGKPRDYEQLSGAMKLSVIFSLKLGLSFLLQKMIGTDIKFLLLDEIDQPLDKASVDAFADIVKFFQKDFKILVITHNDRLKDKFSHAILVDQDINMVSKAQVVSSW